MTQIGVDAYVVDCLLPDLVGHDRRLSSFIVYLYLYRHASQQANWSVRMSHQTIASATGLSRSAAQSALGHLQTRELIATSRAHLTAVPLHRVLRPWLRLGSQKGEPSHD
ncbi:MAG: helix-turn-helix domain-containing protein [Isosphaeraceae bacterium]